MKGDRTAGGRSGAALEPLEACNVLSTFLAELGYPRKACRTACPVVLDAVVNGDRCERCPHGLRSTHVLAAPAGTLYRDHPAIRAGCGACASYLGMFGVRALNLRALIDGEAA